MKLTRPRSGRMIAGVCSGIARHNGWDTGTLRVIFVLSFVVPGPNVFIYIALWLLMRSDDF